MDPNKPALRPPPGITASFDDPPNGNTKAHFGIAISLFLVFAGVSLRAYSRIFCFKKVKLEDYIAFAALAPYIGFIYGMYSFMNLSGFYVHQWNIHANDLPSALYIVYLNTSFFQATMGSMKTAILLEWTRIFVPPGKTTKNSFYWTCQVVMWVNILYYAAVITAWALSCSPHAKIWTPSLPGKCFNTKAFFVTNASLNLASDIVILALPQSSIWGLQMSRRKKIGVSLVFAIGVIATLVGAVRLGRAVVYYLSNDDLYNISALFVWCTAELSVAFLVFCLPAIPKIFSGENWIKKTAASWRLRSSSMKWNHSKVGLLFGRSSSSKPQRKDTSTWNSSVVINGLSLDAEAGRRNDLQYNLVSGQEPRPTDVTKDTSTIRVMNLVSHQPDTSWYDEV